MKRLFSPRLVAAAVALTVAPPLVACGGTAASEQPATASAALTRAPVAASAHGPIRLLGEALGDVPLTPAQRTEVEGLAADAEARHAGARAARGDLLAALATQVQSGAVDRGALQPKLDAISAALQKAQPADRAALERLHSILGPDQRVAFVDAVEAHLQERVGELHDKHPFKQWADDLKLTADQRSQIRASLREQFDAGRGGPERGAPMRRGAKVLAAFKQDRFVMDEVAPAPDVGAEVAHTSERVLRIAEVVVPTLTAEQRTIAAQKLRDRSLQRDADDGLAP